MSETRVGSVSANPPPRVLWQYQQKEVTTIEAIQLLEKASFNVQSHGDTLRAFWCIVSS